MELLAKFVLIVTLLYIYCQYMPYEYPTGKDHEAVVYLTQNISNCFVRDVVQSQLLYCPYQPLCEDFGRTITLTNNNTALYPCCQQQCSCNVSSKAASHKKCPNINKLGLDTPSEVCVRPQYRQFGSTKSNTFVSYKMISSCSPSFSNSHIRSKCESEPTQNEHLDLSLFTPVSVVNESDIYRNTYCATCNGRHESTFRTWKPQFQCSTGTPFDTIPLTQNELLLTMHEDNKCNIVFKDNQYHPRCNWGVYTKCNMTGLWTKYDKEIDNACNSYTFVYMVNYRNVFCYMCNRDTQPKIGCTLKELEPIGGGYRMGTFSGLIRYRSQESVEKQRCSENYIYDDLQEICRVVHCQPYYTYDKRTTTCKALFDQISNQRYGVNLMTELENGVITCNLEDLFCVSSVTKAVEDAILEDVNLKLRVELCKDDYPTKVFLVENSNKTTLIFKMFFHQQYAHDNIMYINSLQSRRSIQFRHNSILTQITLMALSQAEVDFMGNLNDISFTLPQPPFSRSLTCDFKFNSVSVVYNYLCPRLKFQIDDVSFSGGVLHLNDMNISYDLKGVIRQNNSFLVCADVYLNAVKETDINRNIANKKCSEDIIETTLSTICSSFSIISLILLLLVYGVIKEIRTVPGLNTMMLCGYLLLANLLYLFGMRSTKNNFTCVVIGMFIHYLWLASIAWMNICSIHMFRVFVLNSTAVTYSKRVVLIYFLYAFVFSAIFIGINIIEFSINGSENGYLGYGGNHCYITKSIMILISFVVPLGLVVMSNIIMFIWVVIRIKTHPKLDSHNGKERNMLAIYLRLTCLTGVTWAFGIIYHWFPEAAISYTFIILNASQGIFIFVAFGCNARTRNSFCSAVHTYLSKISSNASRSGTFSNNEIT